MNPNVNRVFLDAGVFIGAILLHDPRGPEAYPIVEAARQGQLNACTSVGVLSEVYAALTWTGNTTPHTPADAARSVRELKNCLPPSQYCQTGWKLVYCIYS